jgi:SAM-dependent methyltransferase
METCNASEIEELLKMGLAGVAAGATDMDHLDGAAAAINYIRIADLVESYCKSGAVEQPILDWGCGYGQVSWLMRRRGLAVVSCDVEERGARHSIEALRDMEIHYLRDPLRLPYESGTFGATLSVGVLEHVGADNVEASVVEISRVLKPGGLFFIFMLPNRFSWVEFIADIRGVSVHPDKYTFGRIEDILGRHAFTVQRKWRRNVLPRNLTGLSHGVKKTYGKYFRQIESTDRTLSAVPGVSLFSGVIEVIAKKD